MKTAVLILAGGSGIRLWPLSRKDRPKQFLPVFSNNLSFFQAAVLRALKITDAEDVYVLTQSSYSASVAEQAPMIPEENVFFETYKRNTAPAIALAMMKIKEKYNDAVSVVLPADHFIADNDAFLSAVSDAICAATENNKIITIGISPTRPDTGFGYIKCAGEFDKNIYHTECFKEKPDYATALEFISDKNYYWNSGIFVTKASFILGEYQKYLPDVFELAEKICNPLITDDGLYSEMPEISVDYGILEKSKDILLTKGNFGWDDIGSWTALDRLYKKDSNSNILNGNCIAIDSSDCTVLSKEKLTVTAGTDGLLIINTPDVTLICNKNSAETIKNLPSIIEEKGYKNLL